jgi:hypothetical protein
VTDSFTGLGRSDIEDMFTKGEYLKLYQSAFGTKIKVSDLNGNDRIIDQIGRFTGSAFTKHGGPADALFRDPDRGKFLSSLSKTTLDKFEALFNAVNATLSAERFVGTGGRQYNRS